MEYVLQNDSLTVGLKKRGGELTSIKDKDGLEYLWQADPKYWVGQAPVLFPICGSIRDNKATVGNGKTMTMPRHGIVRKRDFDCVEQQDNSILFAIESNAEMQEQFPYHFKLEIRYTLKDKSITNEYTVYNLDAEKMPFFVGGHPAFNCPLYEGESYEDYKLVFEKAENCLVPTPIVETALLDMKHRTDVFQGKKELPLKHELFAVDSILMDKPNSKSVTLCTEKHGKGLRMDFADFPYLVLWSTRNGAPFVALEPWTGMATCNDESDVFEEKRGIQFLEPGESRKFAFTVTIL